MKIVVNAKPFLISQFSLIPFARSPSAGSPPFERVRNALIYNIIKQDRGYVNTRFSNFVK